MSADPIHDLFSAGQSVWLDFIRRQLLTSGDLRKMIGEGHISGLTSNPTIFEKAIAGSADYDAPFTRMALEGHDAQTILDRLVIEDIQGACDTLRPVYDRTGGRDGFASIEVSPLLAHSAEETIAEARRLWRLVDRPNVMVKIPATSAGNPAVRACLADGININITLIFSVDVYARIAETYLAALEDRVARGLEIGNLASVASFFVSRVDTLVDGWLEAKAREAAPGDAAVARSLLGTIAVANARVAYERFQKTFSGPRWEALAALGARVQRPLWASTGTKNKAYSDVKYVEELIGPDTVNTMPPDTIQAFRDHGKVAPTLVPNFAQAHDELRKLAGLGISLPDACDRLEHDGVRLFADSFRTLMDRVEARREAVVLSGPAHRVASLGALEEPVARRLEALDQSNFARRLFDKDASLWSADPREQGAIRDRLGWLASPEAMREELDELDAFAAEIRSAGFTDAVVLGMGGSSLCPDLFARTFAPAEGRLRLHVLDSTDPVAVGRLRRAIDPARTLFIVSSKSGSTIESNAFADAFEAEVEAAGVRPAGKNFVAITDPDSPLEARALRRGYRRTFLNPPDIGGRYSALSSFGLVPAALLGVDLPKLLEAALAMLRASGPRAGTRENPGLWLGAVLGEAAKAGRDKLTLFVDPGIGALGAWLEQLIAESTGKNGKGIVPVADEPPGAPEAYGRDRLFVSIRLERGGVGAASDGSLDATLDALVRAGHPVVRLVIDDRESLGGEFVRWEVATAVASAILGVNPFDEPNVSESKANTQKTLARFEAEGALPVETALVRDDRLALFASGTHGSTLRPAAAAHDDAIAHVLAAHLATVHPGDTLALIAFFDPAPEEAARLVRLRAVLRDRLGVATTLGIGPRYLHSTGQLQKGGPPTTAFLFLTAETEDERAIPGAPYSFGVLLDAQATGDVAALVARNRRLLRVHLEGGRPAGLERLAEMLRRAAALTPVGPGAAHAPARAS
ncbi:MAG: bifunctional transaldolase/phosoglucose isomerase [Candidatus Eiseniibacteriota bacterium]